MKKRYIYCIALAGVLGLTSCADDFLNKKNTTSLGQEGFFESDEAVAAATAPLYNYVWNSFNEKFIYAMGDGRANNITAQYSSYIKDYTNFSENSLSEGLDGAWNSLYSVVSQSNNAINNILNYSTASVSETAKRQAVAEARFMRGTAYWFLASLWGGAIIYENTTELISGYMVSPHRRTDVMEFAIRDLEYAAMNLPATQGDKGRVTKYSAYGMLSRVYLSMAGLTTEGVYNGNNIQNNFNSGSRNTYYLGLAAKAAEKVIESGRYALLADYHDLFTAENFNNNEESLFQLQWLQGPTASVSGCNNSITAFFGWSTMVADGTNWGGATYCSWNLWREFNGYKGNETGNATTYAPEGVRRHECVASYGEFYPEMNKKNGGYTYGVTENPGNQGANIKKYVIGLLADNGISYKQSVGVNTYMMRLAEVYLNYVEAVMGNNGNTSDPTALALFNEIRKRAGVPELSSVSYDDLRHERRVEFAFEGLYWYDLLNRSYYQQQEVLNYINNQQRNASYAYNQETQVYEISADYVEPGAGVATATARNLVLPVSDSDQNKNPLLKPNENGELNTVAFEFAEKEVVTEDLYK